MALSPDDINNFMKRDSEKIDKALNQAKKNLGSDGAKLVELLKDKKSLEKITSKMSKKDLDKLSDIINNPDLLNKILMNEKTKENIKKMMGD